jgi:hypothetical protein
MTIKKLASLSTIALFAAAVPALAQQVVEAPGVTIIFGAPPAGAMPASQDPFAAMRAIDAEMNAQMNAQMAQMNQIIQAEQTLAATPPGNSLTPAAFGNGAVAGTFVTTVSENGQTCTERVVYPGNGAAAKISVSQTGNACAAMHIGGQPAAIALPTAPAQPAPAQTIQVRNEAGQSAKPIMLADRDN